MKERYSIVKEENGIRYHYHGCDRRGKPHFLMAYAALNNSFYWRVYQSKKVAENQVKRLKKKYDPSVVIYCEKV